MAFISCNGVASSDQLPLECGFRLVPIIDIDVYFGGVFGHFGALIGARGVMDVRPGLPGRG